MQAMLGLMASRNDAVCAVLPGLKLWMLCVQTDFQDVRCVDASKFDWYPDHHRAVSLKKEEAAAKGSKADKEGSKDTSGFQFKVFSLCYITSFDEVRGRLLRF